MIAMQSETVQLKNILLRTAVEFCWRQIVGAIQTCPRPSASETVAPNIKIKTVSGLSLRQVSAAKWRNLGPIYLYFIVILEALRLRGGLKWIRTFD